MKKLVVAASVLASLLALSAGSACAADLAAHPYAKAPAAPLSPAYDWSGFYIGVNLGGAWTHSSSINTALDRTFVSTGSGNNSGVIGGGQIGYNFMIAPGFLLGLEADADGTSLHESVTSPDGSNQRSSKLNAFGTVRGRAGFALDNWLFYGTGGFAWSQGSVTRTQIVAVPAATPPIPALAGTAETSSKTRDGWTAGGGIEWGFARNWTARAEYLYLNLGNTTSTFPLSNRQQTTSLNMNVARLAVNYRF
jgi:outer membrane immunogenic protein